MDSLLSIQDLWGLPWLEITIFLLSIALVLLVFDLAVLRNQDDQPVPFNVPVPDQSHHGWKGREVEEIGVKVCHYPSKPPN